MPSSCKEIRAELAKCMQKSDCVLINRHTVSECLMDKELFDNEVPDECHRLRRSFYNCRRGMVRFNAGLRLR
jgi:cytochrome c oxidase assembly factor 5